MARTKPKSKTPIPPNVNGEPHASEDFDVLTLAEAAAFLRVESADLLRQAQLQDLPGRCIGDEWRFSKSALSNWLATAPPRPSRETLLAAAGSWKDMPDLDEFLEEVYRKRGRPMTEVSQPEPRTSHQAFLAAAGAFKDDPDLKEICQEAMRQRGRPTTEGGK